MRLRFFFLAIIALAVIGDIHAQSGKNILRIRFDTITVTMPTPSVVLNVWWQIDGTKPHNWRGFDCRIAYEKYQIAASHAFSLGTACAQASLFHFEKDVFPYQGEARLQVLTAGNLELDLTKPVLFRIVFDTKTTLYDTLAKDLRGLMEAFRFEVIGSGIDSVFIENGWIQYEPPVAPKPEPKRWNIAISMDSAEVQSDSLVTVALKASRLDSAGIRFGAFGFRYDTAALIFQSAAPGALLAGGEVTAEHKFDGSVTITFAGADTTKELTGAGELLTMQFKARKREDTLCTEFRDTAFFALNEGTHIDTISYSLGSICVLGSKEDVGAVGNSDKQSLLSILPNPAREEVRFIPGDARPYELVIWSMLGERMTQATITGEASIDTRLWMPGIYHGALVLDGRIVEKRAFIIIH